MTNDNQRTSLTTLQTIAQCLQWATQQLADTTDPRRDSELLLTHVLNKPLSYLMTWPQQLLSTTLTTQFADLIQQRQQGTPTAYLLGEWAAYQLTLTVTPDTLIPRPETDTLIAACLQQLPQDTPQRIVDLGTGCGTAALNIAHARPHWHVVATDNSSAALNVARHNAKRHGIHNVDFVLGDWYTPLTMQRFDAVVSNPPYIDVDDPHLLSLQDEPVGALVADDHALAAITHIITDAPDHLHENGWVCVEHGHTQSSAIRDLLHECGFINISTLTDLCQHPRVTMGMWSTNSVNEA